MKRRLLFSALSFLLCLSMLVGTTFAWFTDSVVSANNIIASGNLDLELYWSENGKDWINAENGDPVFSYDLWEPGYTMVRYLKVVNAGSLAFRYEASFTATALGKLAEVIDLYHVDGMVTPTRANLQSVMTDAWGLTDIINKPLSGGKVLPRQEALFTVALKMRESAGNEYMNQQLSDIGIAVFATQAVEEYDSFDNLYDQNPITDPLAALEQKYDFTYFASLTEAVNAVNANTPTAGADEKAQDSAAGVYTDENGKLVVVLLKDAEERISTTADMTIHLAGHTLSATTGTAITVNSGNVYIDGTFPGSAIRVTTGDGVAAKALAINKNCNVTVEGGTYEAEGNTKASACVLCLGNLTANNATFIGRSTTGRIDALSMSAGSTANVTNCNVNTYSTEGKAYGLYTSKNCDITIADTEIIAYGKYVTSGSDYTSSSMGIYHAAGSVLRLQDCHVAGALAGGQIYGTLYVDGGTYEGYGHGGFYLTGENMKAYIQNATIRQCGMPGNYATNCASNNSGMYVGSNSGATVYIDNCDLTGNGTPVVLRGSAGEQNITVYISNSTIDANAKFRIDNDSHTLYLGAGNNFTAEQTARPNRVVVTDETYSH